MGSLCSCLSIFVVVFAGTKPQWKCPSSKTAEFTCLSDGSICHDALYVVSDYSSFASEWKLVCAESYKVELAQSLTMFGLLLGAPLFGSLADKFGRTTIWRISFCGLTLTGMITAFSWSFEIFSFLRLLIGIFNSGVVLTSFILSSEIIGKSERGFWCSALQCFYALGFPCLALCAYFFTNWRVLTLVTSSSGIVLIILAWNLPESPRWLLIKGRTKQAEEILLQAAKENRVENPDFKLKSCDSTPDSEKTIKTYGILHLCSRFDIFKKLVIVTISFFVNNLVYYGLSLNSSANGGNRFVSFALSGLVEIPSYFGCVMFINRSGRCRSLFYFMISGAFSCLVCMKLQSDSSAGAGSDFLVTIFATLGKFAISASFAVIYIYSAELFPTVIRNLALGVIQAASRLGGILAPIVILMGETNKALPMFIFGVCALVAGFIGLLLPETLNQPMPDNLEEVIKHKC